MGSECGTPRREKPRPTRFDTASRRVDLPPCRASPLRAADDHVPVRRWATYAVNAYTVTSANDEPGRDPKSWQLEGSNDEGATWTAVDTQTDQTFANRFQTNATCYRLFGLRSLSFRVHGDGRDSAALQPSRSPRFSSSVRRGHGPTDPCNRANRETVTTTSICGAST